MCRNEKRKPVKVPHLSFQSFTQPSSPPFLLCSGLAKHKDELGAPLCPCRHYEDKAAEVQLAYWNCPCVPMRERKECHCMLFLTPDTPFVGTEQKLPDEMLKDEGLGLK